MEDSKLKWRTVLQEGGHSQTLILLLLNLLLSVKVCELIKAPIVDITSNINPVHDI
jgi:hypothetical protein